MQVAHASDLDTHAVIGGSEIKEFGIAQTAEFFTVLSSALYSNKPMAVIREVLCNAWDAHINAGVTDRAVEISLHSNKLVIRDFGFGIHPKDMHRIYCIYGASTKVNDGKQTGGFGLGSKAPFAYSDHFTVTTHHMGLKTVYAISRGSAATKGTPDMRVIVQVPTTETGLEVSIPVKNDHDRETFENYIQNITAYGEMKVELDGNMLETVPISQAEDNFFITKNRIPSDVQSQIYIRYGGIIYPVAYHDDYSTSYGKVRAGLNQLNDNYRIILQAPSDSISVTPSRESLSMTDTTIETLKGLLAHAARKLAFDSREYTQMFLDLEKEAIDWYWLSCRPWSILTAEDIYPLYMEKTGQRAGWNQNISSMLQLAKVILVSNNNASLHSDMVRVSRRIDLMIEAGWPAVHLLKKFRNFFRVRDVKAYEGKARQLFRPLIRNVVKNPILKIEKLHYMFRSSYENEHRNSVKLTSAKPDWENLILTMRNTIILAHSRKEIFEYLKTVAPVLRLRTSHLFYLVPANQNHKREAKETFERLGYTVINLAGYIDSFPKVVVEKVKKEYQGILALSNLFEELNAEQKRYSDGCRMYHREFYSQGTRIKTPEFVIKPIKVSVIGEGIFFPFGDDREFARNIANLYGDRGGFVTLKSEYDDTIKRGAVEGNKWIVDHVYAEIAASKNLKAHLALRELSEQSPGTLTHLKSIEKIVERSDSLRAKLHYPENLTPRERMLLEVHMHLLYNSGEPGPWKEAAVAHQKTVRSWKAARPLQRMIKALSKNRRRFLVINLDKIYEQLASPFSASEREFFEKLILTALK